MNDTNSTLFDGFYIPLLRGTRGVCLVSANANTIKKLMVLRETQETQETYANARDRERESVALTTTLDTTLFVEHGFASFF